MRKDAPVTQLDFFSNCTEQTLKRHLEERLQRPLSLVLTDNLTRMLSMQERQGVLCVRMHRMFLGATGPVLDEIISFLKTKNRSLPRFRQFVHDNAEKLRKRTPRRITERTDGKYHDLRELYRRINEEYFDGAVNAAITWGAKRPRLAAQKRTLGSYSAYSHTIRINPALDRKAVPRYYVAFVVYHEMLHAVMGIPRRGKRRIIHSREFRNRERLFKDYERAAAWERGRAS